MRCLAVPAGKSCDLTATVDALTVHQTVLLMAAALVEPIRDVLSDPMADGCPYFTHS
jgi:hypothetical protein